MWNSLANAAIPIDFNTDRNTSLSGQWQYYPNTLIYTPNYPHHALEADSETVELPNSFLNLTGNRDGIGSFQQHFLLPEAAVGKTVYVYVPYQYGAYEIYVNGRLIAKMGQVGDVNSHKTMMAPKLASFFSDRRDVELTIQASSFKHIRGGLENQMYMGYTQPILHQFYRQVIPLSLTSGMLFMTGSFMLLFVLYRSRQTFLKNPLLYLSLFILFFSFRSFFAVPFLYSLFTNINWLWGTRFEYLLTELASISFVFYLYLLPLNLIHRWIFRTSLVLIVINIVLTLSLQPVIFQDVFFKSFIFSFVLFANLILSIFRIYKNKIHYSKVNAFAIFILCMTFLHDYLLGLKLIDSVEIAFYSSCIYFICVTFQLSYDYANKSFQSEHLNYKLLQLNKSLDRKVAERTRTVEELNQKLERQVLTDALTGSYNRHALNIEVKKRYEEACRLHHTLAFLMIDVDFFKNYNDMYGHLKGDDVLKNLVTTLQKILPDNAFLARYGGEEFAVIFSDLSFETVTDLAAQCLEEIRQQNWQHHNRPDHKTIVTISIGGAVMDCQHVYADLFELMKEADRQLYKAKEQRDSACINS
ncbi:sensor domain-containing diguanylate cyclase [Acinetobacter sp. NCu2D-2]|uniref:sensor domain-containing diguanylate cyclase n=1 Tax=Acinetobacter sp. NCu2D-2 TaxID=1608473 RepID=UPI0012FF031E|nr:diguanylate cyclase [Acinetobacter sp. NCu2D-2]